VRALVLFALVLAGCSGCHEAPGPLTTPLGSQPVSTVRPGALTAYAPTCTGACSRGHDLACPSAAPSPGGVACVDRCTQSSLAPWDVTCMAAATTCATFDACGSR
jgi:hypothetical protein